MFSVSLTSFQLLSSSNLLFLCMSSNTFPFFFVFFSSRGFFNALSNSFCLLLLTLVFVFWLVFHVPPEHFVLPSGALKLWFRRFAPLPENKSYFSAFSQEMLQLLDKKIYLSFIPTDFHVFHFKIEKRFTSEKS